MWSPQHILLHACMPSSRILNIQKKSEKKSNYIYVLNIFRLFYEKWGLFLIDYLKSQFFVFLPLFPI